MLQERTTPSSHERERFDGEPFQDRLRELEQCRAAGGYAGEVALSEEEVVALARVVRSECHRALIKRAVSGRFILLTVNCAYYRMAAASFWPSFCALLGCPSDEATLHELRRRSEEALRQWEFQDEPYLAGLRYVTPIRLQAGLTRHDLPAFAGFLDAARSAHGWPETLRMPHAEFLAFLRAWFPVRTRFVRFLEEEAGGGALTRAVLSDLVRWRQGLLGNAPYPSAAGYRPGFWEELWPHLNVGPAPARNTARPVRPGAAKFIFDATSARFGLLFPQALVDRRAYRLEGSLVHEGFLARRQLSALLPAYEVEEKTPAGDWRASQLPGWAPSAVRPCALFLPTGDLVPPGSVAEPGIYSLVSAAAGGNPPPGITLLTDFEYIDLTGAALRFWQIELDAESDPAALGYRRGAAHPLSLAWAEPVQRLRGAADAAEIFLGRLPALRLEHAGEFRANRRVLCCEHGGTVEVVPIPQTGGETAVLSLPLAAPCVGGLWVETLGRSRTGGSQQGAAERLSFCLLPPCAVTWPEDLYAPDEEPAIRFSAADEAVTADFPVCERRGGAEWAVLAGECYSRYSRSQTPVWECLSSAELGSPW